MPNCIMQTFDSPAALEQSLINSISEKLIAAVNSKGSASIAVSGGNTPRPLFAALSQEPLPWDKITVTLADERWVATTEDDSNEKLVRNVLLQNLASQAAFLPFKNDASTAAAGQPALAKELTALGPVDVLILGMGGDGHTASLFPCCDELGEVMKTDNPQPCHATTPKTAPYERMTMTLSWLLKSAHIMLHITGQSKFSVLTDALENPTTAPPIGQLIQQAQQPVSVFYTD